MRVVPIIVAFRIEGEALAVFYSLNQECDLKKGIDFNYSTPHVSLWMGFVAEGALLGLSKEFYKVFGNLATMLDVCGVELYNGIEGRVLSASLSKTKFLYLLQNRLHHFFEPYRCKPQQYLTFSNSTLSYLNDFTTKSLSQYDPHVTIGFSDELLDLSIEKFIVSEPKIFLAGNNCTCLKVID